MTATMPRAVARVTFPGGLLLITAALSIRFAQPFISTASFARYCAPVALSIGLLLSAIFRRSRLFLATFICTLVYTTSVWVLPRLAAFGIGAMVLNAMAVLLPLNLGVLSFSRDRGILTASGARRIAIVGAQIVLVAVVALTVRDRGLMDPLQYPVVDGRWTNWSRISQPALIAFIVVFVLLLIRLACRYRSVDGGLLWTLAAMLVALNVSLSHVFNFLVATAAVILVAAVLETSHSMAYRDELTDLPGRRAFNEDLAKVSGRYAIGMIDIDHFKRVNDTYGHRTGDQVLRSIASKLAVTPGESKAYRYGGEEFAMLFSGKASDEAFLYLERLRKAIEESHFTMRGADRRKRKTSRRWGQRPNKQLTTTVSIGVASTESGNLRPQQVVEAADKALYRAKANGRNCTMLSPPA